MFVVAGKRTFTSLVSKVKAKVQDFDQQRYAGIFVLSACYSLSLPREGTGDRGKTTSTHSTYSFTHTPTSYRNTANASSSDTGASIGTGYAAQAPSTGVDRHAQQAYYAPRVSPNPQQPGSIDYNNDTFES